MRVMVVVEGRRGAVASDPTLPAAASYCNGGHVMMQAGGWLGGSLGERASESNIPYSTFESNLQYSTLIRGMLLVDPLTSGMRRNNLKC